MNTCVSDDSNIVNIQGIRYVSWGEMTSGSYSNPSGKFFVTVTYKGNHTTFYYKHESAARSFFNGIRAAMDSTSRRGKNESN